MNGNKVFICESKWDFFGVYRHEWDKLPAEHYDDADNDGEPDVLFYRYTQGEHFWGWNNVSDTHHEWKCNVCSATTNARANHTFEYTGAYIANGHKKHCDDCGYSFYEAHDLYMYQDNGEDGCIVKCHDCTYVINCPEAPEYDPAGASGHYINCPSGEFVIFEEHSGLFSQIIGDVFYHNGYCTDCNYSYTEFHTWVSVSGGYRCADCGMTTTNHPIITSLSDQELEAFLATLSEDDLAELIASLDPEARNRVALVLAPSDDDFVTE